MWSVKEKREELVMRTDGSRAPKVKVGDHGLGIAVWWRGKRRSGALEAKGAWEDVVVRVGGDRTPMLTRRRPWSRWEVADVLVV
jgi:hypothetical protein